MRIKQNLSILAYVYAFLIVILFDLGLWANDSVINQKNLFHGVGILALLIFFSIVAVFGIGFLIEKLYHRWDVSPIVRVEDEKPITDKKYLIICALLILACWIPYMIIRFPGNYDPDTWQQLLQPSGHTISSDHHPWFDTLIFYGFWKIGDVFGSHQVSLFLYAVFQTAATAFSFAYTSLFLRRNGVASSDRRTALLFWALYPFIPMVSQTMAKDMLNGWLFLLYSVFYLEYIQKCQDPQAHRTWKDSLKFILAAILMSLTKKTGIYIFLLSSIFLVLYIRLNLKGLLKLAGEILAVFLFCVVIWQGICLPAMGVQKGDSKELMSVPSQQIAWYIKKYGNTLDKKDWRILSGVYENPKHLSDDYNPIRADATKSHWREDASSTAKSQFYHYYLKLSLRHPGNFLQSFCANIYPMLCVDNKTMGNESLIFYRDNVPEVNGGDALEQLYSLWSGGKATKKDVHVIMASSYKSHALKKVSKAWDAIYNCIANAAAVLFSKVVFVTWIPLLILFYGLHKRSWCMIFALSPMFWNVMTLAAGPILLPRYMVTSVYLAPLLLCMPRLYFLYRDDNNGSSEQTALLQGTKKKYENIK